MLLESPGEKLLTSETHTTPLQEQRKEGELSAYISKKELHIFPRLLGKYQLPAFSSNHITEFPPNSQTEE